MFHLKCDCISSWPAILALMKNHVEYLTLFSFCRYVIGKDGVVKKVYNSQFDPESHIPAALEAL